MKKKKRSKHGKIWCLHPDCLESDKQYKNTQDLCKHINKTHKNSTINTPIIHTKVLDYENETIEYKSNIKSCTKDKICQTIISMFNCLGGNIYFGVTDDRFINGITNNCNWDKYMLEIANCLKYYSEPFIPTISSGHTVLTNDRSLFWIKIIKNNNDNKLLYKEKQYIRCLSSNQLIENTVESYNFLLSENKKTKKKLQAKQNIIDDLNEEIDTKNEYIKNILTYILKQKKKK